MRMYKELNARRAMQAHRVRPRGVDPLGEEYMWRGDYHPADEVIDQNKIKKTNEKKSFRRKDTRPCGARL